MQKTENLWAGVLVVLLSTACSGKAAVQSAEVADLRRDATVLAVEVVMPSVVNVATAAVVEYPDFYDRLMRDFYGWGNSVPHEKLNSIGSGVIIDEDGWVLTNLHVLRRASRVEVKLWNGEVYEADPVVAAGLSDVALLKVRLPAGVKLKAVQFADDDDLLLGETVLALGNPFGLGGTVTRGILSSKNRRPASDDVQLNYQDWLQTDAAINPGNSGGPLINLRGELIGLNVAVYLQGQGIGFAIPVKQVVEALSKFYTPEVSDALWFGARVKAADDQLTVSFVQPGSPAAESGIEVGHEILEVNGLTPVTLIEFNEFLRAAADHEVTVKTRSGSATQVHQVTMVPFDTLILKKLGISMVFLGMETDARFRIPGRAGLYIKEVEREGPAEQAGLKPGMFLAGLGDKEVRDLLAVASVVSATRPGDVIPMIVVEPQRVAAGFVRYQQRGVQVTVR